MTTPEIELRVSPRYTVQKIASGKTEDRIDIYEDRVRGWMLDHARTLVSHPETEYAVLALLITYFEPHAGYRLGTASSNKSREFFRTGFCEVFRGVESKTPGVSAPPDFLTTVGDKLYNQARCGITHEGLTREGILLSYRVTEAIGASIHKATKNINAIFINPCLLLAAIEEHLQRYVAELRDPANVAARHAFDTACRLRDPTEGTYHIPREAFE